MAGEDPEFGAYTSNSKEIDSITYFAPNFLSVWSSGNECEHDGIVGTDLVYRVLEDANNDGVNDISTLVHPQDSGDPLPGATKIPDLDGGELLNIPGPGFDTIRSTGCAKNNITVGNIKDIPGGVQNSSDIEIWNSSSRGPTDDGRVKPDLVANGEFVQTTDSSSQSNTSATTRVTGTSLSAPCITGTLRLLHQLNEDAGRSPLLASTWKALLLNTAVDATDLPDYIGTQAAAANLIGPDYFYGWGVCDAESAAELLDLNIKSSFENHLCEHMLYDGKTIEIPICYDGQSSEMRVMICWTDVPYQTETIGNVNSEVMDPESGPADIDTIRLINDLDLVVRAPDGTVHEPWVLDPENPMNAATVGNNDRDNVEQVIIPTPQDGNYTVCISHKGSLKRMTVALDDPLVQDGAFILTDNAEQAVSICITGNKDPNPILPRLRIHNMREVNSGAAIPWYLVDLRFDGFLGVRYQLQVSSDLENWVDQNDPFDAVQQDQTIYPVLIRSSEARNYIRARAISPND